MTAEQGRSGADAPVHGNPGGEETSPAIRVRLEIFEGPLDLLLHLVRENRLDIHDIPIAKITEQYLAYLDVMKAMNLEVAGEFLVMASTLLYIKSRSLLPRPDDEAGEGEDPETLRAELSRRLVEYRKIKEAAIRLGERPLLGREVFARDFLGEEIPEGEVLLAELSLADLITAFKDVLERMPEQESVDVYVDRLPIADAIAFLLDRLREEGAIRFDRLLEEVSTKQERISFFLGILELVRLRTVKVYQAVTMGLITIVPAVREEDDGRGHEGSGTG